MYLSAKDFERESMNNSQKKFFRDFSSLLYNIITPEYANIWEEGGPQSFDFDFMDQEDNVILFYITATINTLPIKPDQNTFSDDLIDKYSDIKNTAINNINQKMYPQIANEYLRESNIQPDHYTFETFAFNTKLDVYTFVDTEYKKENYYGDLYHSLSFILEMRIRKTSILDREHDESKSKLNSLCRRINLISKKDLNDWAERLKIKNYETMDKGMLCSEIRKYYGWQMTGSKYLNY